MTIEGDRDDGEAFAIQLITILVAGHVDAFHEGCAALALHRVRAYGALECMGHLLSGATKRIAQLEDSDPAEVWQWVALNLAAHGDGS